MLSDRKRTTILSILLAVPPVMLVATICNDLLPKPDPVPAVVTSNDQIAYAHPAKPSWFQVVALRHQD